MTAQLAFELGQFAYRLKEHGADSLYEDFMKIAEKLLMNEPGNTVPVINQPSNWTIRTEPMKPSSDPLDPWKITCELNSIQPKAESREK